MGEFIDLSDDATAQEMLTTIRNRESILMHGCGGVGKSVNIRYLAARLTDLGKKVYITATTGIAAVNLSVPKKLLSGSTLHSWAGVALGDAPPQKLVAKVKHHEKARQRWLETDVLFIDEVSMLGAEFFDKLDFIGRAIRSNPLKPFGGIQLFLSGDFLQLPPVNDKWVFQSHVWKELTLVPYVLETPKRYTDMTYFSRLLRFRKAAQTPDDIKFLRERQAAYGEWKDNETKNKDKLTIKPTILYSKKVDVEFSNNQELERLSGIGRDFIAVDSFTPYNKHARAEQYIKLLDEAIPKSITLKAGAQVMLKANLDIKGGLANGSRGVVTEVTSDGAKVKWRHGGETLVTVHTWTQEDKEGLAVRSQVPLVLAWALTTHKCLSENTAIFDAGTEWIEPIGRYSKQDGWVAQEISVHTRTGVEKTKGVYRGEVEDSITIVTSKGYMLEGSHRHPVLVSQDGEEKWITLPELKMGNQMILKAGMRVTKRGVTPCDLNYQSAINRLRQTGNMTYRVGQSLDCARLEQIWLLDAGLVSSIISGPYDYEVCLSKEDNQWVMKGDKCEPYFFTDTITSITYGRCQMYDFEVPGSHSFISNGFVSHNCQGCTLDYAICDLGPSVFAAGQAYVALSRVRSADGLLVSDLYPKNIIADQRALDYVAKIEKESRAYHAIEPDVELEAPVEETYEEYEAQPEEIEEEVVEPEETYQEVEETLDGQTEEVLVEEEVPLEEKEIQSPEEEILEEKLVDEGDDDGQEVEYVIEYVLVFPPKKAKVPPKKLGAGVKR